MPDVAKQIGTCCRELAERSYFCEAHGEYKGKPLEYTFGTHKIFDPPCPTCEAEQKDKEARTEADRIKAAEERARARIVEERARRLAGMNIGEKFWEESFDTFNPYTPELKRHLETCIAFADNCRGGMLVMLGNNGNGKDHLAASILKKIGGYIYTVFEIELLLRQGYSGKGESEADIYKRLWEAPLLVINEIGRHKADSKWSLDFLSNVIDKRYQNLKPTVLVSNCHLLEDCPETEKGCDKCLQRYLGNDILSRIIEGGEVMHFTGEDYRYRKREMRMTE
ncbi:MAG: ATP-binding protein [Treponema sp.]|jgi:DNA replication protein DnaC|nr:ATP-binding protein [Treponema sp.]